MNAALARAAVGGLVGSTLTTLFVVPVVYALVRRRAPIEAHDPDLDDDVGGAQPTAPIPATET